MAATTAAAAALAGAQHEIAMRAHQRCLAAMTPEQRAAYDAHQRLIARDPVVTLAASEYQFRGDPKPTRTLVAPRADRRPPRLTKHYAWRVL